MYNKIYKNHQVNVGIPFQIKTPINYTYQTVGAVNRAVEKEDDLVEEPEKESAEDFLESAREEAGLIIEEAQYEAARIIEAAAKEAEESRIAVEEEARMKGYEEGIQQGKCQYDELIREAEAVRENAINEYKNMLDGLESEALSIIMDIAKSVIGDEISNNKESIIKIIRQAFEKCTNREKITLRVSSGNYDYVEENKSRLISLVDGIRELEVKVDAGLSDGACIVDTPFGSVDAGVETKLRKIEEAFKQVSGI